MIRKTSVLLPVRKESIYKDAIIIGIHESNYDIKFSDGTIRKYVQNSSEIRFNHGNYVAVLISGENRGDYRIIGRGKKINLANQIKTVVV